MARTFKLVLLVMTLLHAAWFAFRWSCKRSGVAGLLNANGTPLAGLAERFMAFERTIISAGIGLRLWAYRHIRCCSSRRWA